jgi:uncharacterized protein
MKLREADATGGATWRSCSVPCRPAVLRHGCTALTSAALLAVAGCAGRNAGSVHKGSDAPARSLARRLEPRRDPLAPIPKPRTAAERIVNGAKEEARREVRYDAGYYSVRYPGGDVPADRGACTDLVVRALRHAGYDLQRLIHEDMRRRFREYPRRYGLSRPDRNVDHRRTPNQITFFERYGLSLRTSTTGAAARSWQPGDLVYWRLPGGSGHVGVCSDVRNEQGLPLVIHNIGPVARQQDCLTAWTITHHFRYPPPRR